MSLSIHRSERSDALIAGLADLLTESPRDAFDPDVVAVPSKGVERWISQSLSAVLGTSAGSQDGVCANVIFPSPGRLVSDAVAGASGFAADDDPWVSAGTRIIDPREGRPQVLYGLHCGRMSVTVHWCAADWAT